jgi:hypothetical protein
LLLLTRAQNNEYTKHFWESSYIEAQWLPVTSSFQLNKLSFVVKSKAVVLHAMVAWRGEEE